MTISNLYAARDRSGIAVLDARRGRGRWRFLDPIGAQLWLSISGGTAPDQAVELLSVYWAQRGADADHVRASLQTLAADLSKAQLLQVSAPPARTPNSPTVRFATRMPVRLLDRAAAHAGLATALVLLRLLPVRYALAAANAATRLPGLTATTSQADAVFAAVRKAARWWPGRVACLEESLAAHFTAALTGRHVRWVVGARFAPHGAHAWIEAEDAIIGQDESDRVWPYVPALQVERSH